MSRLASSSFFFFLAAIIFLAACTKPAPKLEDYGAVPSFTLTDSHGKQFNSDQLKGKVWIADFIYTNCPGPCPRMTAQMHKLSERLKDNPGVRLLSISVDPQRDTPAVLNAFAHRFGGPTPQWTFLTGPIATIDLLAVHTFHIGTVLNRLNHSTRFMLIDKSGHLRGYYSTFDPGGLEKLQADAGALQ